jgi:hypothetical protein
MMLIAAAAGVSIPMAVSSVDAAPSLRPAQLTDTSAARKKVKKKPAKEQYMRAVPSK